MSQTRTNAIVRTECFVLRPEVRAFLSELLKAHNYAHADNSDVWRYALKHHDARKDHKITSTDLKYLSFNQMIDCSCGSDVSRLSDESSTFVLTQRGVEMAESLEAAAEPRPSILAGPADKLRPRFDSQLRELWYHNLLVKRYREPAKNQECILTAFEEEGWPDRIDDPLSPVPQASPKQRLSDTIKNLNKHHNGAGLIVFAGDGRGEGVVWRTSRGNS